jgi:hypothetical protein
MSAEFIAVVCAPRRTLGSIASNRSHAGLASDAHTHQPAFRASQRKRT